MADAFADQAADLHQVSDVAFAEYDYMISRAALVRNRLIAVLQRVQDFDEEELARQRQQDKTDIELGIFTKPHVETKAKVTRQLLPSKWSDEKIIKNLKDLGHDPIVVNTKSCTLFRCRTCKVHSTPKQIASFLDRGICRGLGKLKPFQPLQLEKFAGFKRDDNRGTQVATAAKSRAVDSASDSSAMAVRVHDEHTPALYQELDEPPIVGKQRLHPSHRLEHKKGIIICQQCGYYSISRPGLLAKTCVPIAAGVKSGGKDFLSRWTRDLTPKPSVKWPSSFSTLPDGVIWTPRSS